MTTQGNNNEPINQTVLPGFSWQVSHTDRTLTKTNPKSCEEYLRSEEIVRRSQVFVSLPTDEQKIYRLSSFRVAFFGCLLDEQNKFESYSGLLLFAIETNGDRCREIYEKLAHDPLTFFLFAGVQNDRVYVCFQAEQIPLNEQEFNKYFESGLFHLKNHSGLTDTELKLTNCNAKNRCFLASNGNIYTNFFPRRLIIQKPIEPKLNGQGSHTVLNDLLNEIKQERQQAENPSTDDNKATDYKTNYTDSPDNIGLLTVRTGNGWINEAKTMPIPKMLFDEFWREGEMCIAFAEANQGKSILAVQIGDSISRGTPIKGFRMEAQAQVVLYFDFELSTKQFEERYSNNFQDHFRWHSHFRRVEINPEADVPEGQSFEEFLNESMEETILKTDAKVLVIDNITFLRSDTETAKDAGPLMKYFKALKRKFNLSILILAHCPKRDPSRPLTRNDLQGSSRLNQFADSMIAIGASAKDIQLKYLKQVKVRSTAYRYDSDNVAVCQIYKPGSFLMLELLRFSTEHEHLKQPTEKDTASLSQQIQTLKEQGKNQTQIAQELGISQSKVSRYLAKLTAK